MGQVTPNFSWEEAASSDGKPVPVRFRQNTITLCQQVEKVRSAAGDKPVSVHCIYRSPAQNAAVGGVSNSEHLVAKAIDFHIDGLSIVETYCIVLDLIEAGEIIDGGVGIYPGHIHYDIGPSRRWNEDIAIPDCSNVNLPELPPEEEHMPTEEFTKLNKKINDQNRKVTKLQKEVNSVRTGGAISLVKLSDRINGLVCTTRAIQKTLETHFTTHNQSGGALERVGIPVLGEVSKLVAKAEEEREATLEELNTLRTTIEGEGNGETDE